MSQLNDVPAIDVVGQVEPAGTVLPAGADVPVTVAVSGPAPASLLEREGEVAADFLERLLDIADLDGDIDVDVEGDRAAVAIVDSEEGRVPRRLVGPEGKVLEALQELTRLAVQAATGERSRLMLDVAGHRAERRTVLVGRARAAIQQARESRERVALDPMTAFERKVVHDEVVGAGLRSESEGVEPSRYVVILPDTDSTASTGSTDSTDNTASTGITDITDSTADAATGPDTVPAGAAD